MFLLFDPLVRDSFIKVSETYTDAIEAHAANYQHNAPLAAIVVATHADVWEHFLTDDNARPPDAFQDNMSLATDWCERHGIRMISVSCLTGSNCKMLIRSTVQAIDERVASEQTVQCSQPTPGAVR